MRLSVELSSTSFYRVRRQRRRYVVDSARCLDLHISTLSFHYTREIRFSDFENSSNFYITLIIYNFLNDSIDSNFSKF